MWITTMLLTMPITVQGTGIYCKNCTGTIEETKLAKWRNDNCNIMKAIPLYCEKCINEPQEDEPINTNGSAFDPNFEKKWDKALKKQEWVNNNE